MVVKCLKDIICQLHCILIMEMDFLLSGGKLLALFEQAVNWHLLDLHHIYVVSHCHHYLIAQSNVFVCIYYPAWSQLPVLTHVGNT